MVRLRDSTSDCRGLIIKGGGTSLICPEYVAKSVCRQAISDDVLFCARTEVHGATQPIHLVTKKRMVALIGPVAGERYATHTAGIPMDPAKMLPVADVILLVVDDMPGAMLFRYTAHGEYGGDTWHQTVGDAEEQAVFEYEEALLPWMDVPEEVADAHDFAVRFARDRLNDRGGW
jgi:hypothetical protein